MNTDLLAAAQQHLAAKRLPEALAAFESLLAQAPASFEAADGLGQTRLALGDAAGAVAAFEQAAQIRPGSAQAWSMVGFSRFQSGDVNAALVAFQQAVALDGRHALGHYWTGYCLLRMGRPLEAVEPFQTAISLRHDLLNRLSYDFFTQQQACNWSRHEDFRILIEAAARSGGPVVCDPITMMLYSGDEAALGVAARSFARAFPAQTQLVQGPHPPGQKIRVAFLSSDFRVSPVAYLFAGPIEAFDRSAFHLTALSYGPPDDSPIRRRIEAAFDTFVEVPDTADPLALARMLSERRIDIAVGVNGYTKYLQSQILAHRPAPVQVSYQGYPGSLGQPYMDYLFADHHVTPPGADVHYAERLVRMPHTYQPTDDKAPVDADTPSRAEEGLPEGAFVFMGYNSTHKLTPQTFRSWMRILHRAPGSVLWVQGRDDAVKHNLRREAAASGVDAARLVFAARHESRSRHLARHRLADLFLDTWPYNAHSTASDALWAGLPVLTLEGTSFAGRVCAGLVRCAGLPELVAPGVEDYEEMAVSLAKDPAAMAALKAKVGDVASKSPLFDTAGFTRNVEKAFRVMFERSQAGLPPEAFDVV